MYFISSQLVLDLYRIFNLHLLLASFFCFGFGLYHLTGIFGPGMWTSDSFGIIGSVRLVKPGYSIAFLTPFSYGVISSHHVVSGLFGTLLSLWHISSRPGPLLYKTFIMGNIEEILSSSLSFIFFTAFVISAFMWYSSVTTSIELFGPSRYHWDTGYFSLEIERRISLNQTVFFNKSFAQIPEKLILSDYLGCNPAKGGLFRSGALVKGDGLVKNWMGHFIFEMGLINLTVRRMPAFFETFPVILIDIAGNVRADIPFRRAESRYSLEQNRVELNISGGILDGTEYITVSIIKNFVRKDQFGEVFSFDKTTGIFDGVFRTSTRGWYTFAHVTLSILFFFGHLWHGGRAIF